MDRRQAPARNLRPARRPCGKNRFPSDFRISDPYLPGPNDPKLYSHDGKLYYMPYEATVTLSSNGSWFYHPNVGAKPVEQLMDIFEAGFIERDKL